MGAHEARDQVAPVVEEVVADGAVVDAVAGEAVETDATAEVRDQAVEVWEPTFDFARKLGATMVREYGKRAAAVAEAGGAEIEEDGVTLKTPAGIMIERVQPSVALMPLARAPLIGDPRTIVSKPLERRWWTPVVEAKQGMLFGWTVAEAPHTDSKAKAAKADGEAGEKTKSSLLVDLDDDEARLDEMSADDAEDDEELDLDEVIERVVVIGGVRKALRLIVGTRSEMVRSQGDQGGPVRIAAAQRGTEDDDLAVIEEYARRNRFANVSVQTITPELIASGGLNTSDPVGLGIRVREGLQALTRRLTDKDY